MSESTFILLWIVAPIVSLVTIFLIARFVVPYHIRTCPNCDTRVHMEYVGYDYRHPYDGRCSKCHMGVPCGEEELIR